MSFVLVFLQNFFDLSCKVRVNLCESYGHVLVNRAFAYSVDFCGAAYCCLVIYYIFSEYDTSFTFRIRYRSCSGFHKIAPFIRRHGFINRAYPFAQIYAVNRANMITPYLSRYGVQTVDKPTHCKNANRVYLNCFSRLNNSKYSQSLKTALRRHFCLLRVFLNICRIISCAFRLYLCLCLSLRFV